MNPTQKRLWLLRLRAELFVLVHVTLPVERWLAGRLERSLSAFERLRAPMPVRTLSARPERREGRS